MDRTAEVGAVPFGVGLEDGSSAYAVPTHGPPLSPPLPWPPEGSCIRPQTSGEGALGARFPPFSLLTSLGLEGVTLSQFHLSEPQKSLPL